MQHQAMLAGAVRRIQGISSDGVTQGLHVYPQLVTASSQRLEFDQRRPGANMVSYTAPVCEAGLATSIHFL